jgi:hypothetical protein
MIDRFISNLMSCGFRLQRERSFPEFLGISIDPVPKGEEGKVHIAQMGIILKR